MLETGIFLIIFIHIFSCVYISIGWDEKGWITNKDYTDDVGELYLAQMTHNDAFEIYWTAFYFICTTMSTVGYGDLNAYSGD